MKKTWKSPKDVPGPAVRVIQHRRTFNIDPYFVFWWRNIYFVHFCSNKISLLCFYSFDLSWWFFCIFVQKNILTVLLFFATAARGLKTKMCAELKSVQYWIVVSEIFKMTSKPSFSVETKTLIAWAEPRFGSFLIFKDDVQLKNTWVGWRFSHLCAKSEYPPRATTIERASKTFAVIEISNVISANLNLAASRPCLHFSGTHLPLHLECYRIHVVPPPQLVFIFVELFWDPNYLWLGSYYFRHLSCWPCQAAHCIDTF